MVKGKAKHQFKNTNKDVIKDDIVIQKVIPKPENAD